MYIYSIYIYVYRVNPTPPLTALNLQVAPTLPRALASILWEVLLSERSSKPKSKDTSHCVSLDLWYVCRPSPRVVPPRERETQSNRYECPLITSLSVSWAPQAVSRPGLGLNLNPHRSWLQDTLKRKLVDSAWNRRFFYLPGACLPFFGSTRLKVSINPIFFIRGACFDQSSGQPRVNPGKQEGGRAHKNQNIGEFSFRGISQSTTAPG